MNTNTQKLSGKVAIVTGALTISLGYNISSARSPTRLHLETP